MSQGIDVILEEDEIGVEVAVDIVKVSPELEDLIVTPSLEEQSFKSNKYGYNNITVKAIETEEINIVPSTEEQVKEGVFNKVTVVGDDNLVAENIKEGVEIFNVTGTAKGEPRLNIFMQEEEPETKEGIWLKTSELSYDSVAFDKDLTGEPKWDTEANISDMPFYFVNVANNKAFTIGDKIYICCCGSTANVYEYDIKTDTYKQLTSPPVSVSKGTFACDGKNIYAVGTESYGYLRIYKYNISTDAYSQVYNSSTKMPNPEVICVGTNIYIFGSSSTSYDDKAYKFDTVTNTLFSCSTIPYNFINGSVASVGTDIYLFGCQDNPTYCYKYDTLTNTYTKKANVPVSNYYTGTASVGTKIYLFGGFTNPQACYEYDTLTDTYKQMPTRLYAWNDYYPVRATAYGSNKIYVFGGLIEGEQETSSSSYKKVQVLDLGSKEYENNSVVVSQGAMAYQTQLVDTKANGRMLVHFNDVFHYTTENKLDKSMPRYYGNGTEWIEI